MPRGDRTGPWGTGPRTGRARGYCAGYSNPGFMYPGPGLGLGRGFGRGYGRGISWGLGLGRGRGWKRGGFSPFWSYPPMMAYGPGYWTDLPPGPAAVDPKEEKQYLQEQMDLLQEELAEINKRLEELKKQEKEKK